MQRLGEHFFAHPRFTAEQHRGTGGCHLRNLMTGNAERSRNTDHVVLQRQAAGRAGRLYRFALGWRPDRVHLNEVRRVPVALLGAEFMIGQAICRIADNPAAAAACGHAFDLTVHHQLADKGAGITGGVAEGHPARSLVANPVVGYVLMGFTRVVPQVFPVEVAAFDVQVKVDRFHPHHTLQRMQPAAGNERAALVRCRPALAYQRGILATRRITDAHQDAPRAFAPDAFDQLAAQCTQRAGMQHDHALVVQPDTRILI
ncbi:hypothetical protein D3C81_1072910 [compost metagenome]